MDLFAESQKGHKLSEIPLIRDFPHEASHEHFLLLPVGIAPLIDPADVRRYGVNFFGSSDKSFVIDLWFP